MTAMTRLGHLLRLHRAVAHISIREQADEIGLTKSTLQRLESADAGGMTLATFQQLQAWLLGPHSPGVIDAHK